jgi:hypothetical protein
MSGFQIFSYPSLESVKREIAAAEKEFLVIGRINDKCPNCEELIPEAKICPRCSYDLSVGMAPENLSETMKVEVRSYLAKRGFAPKINTDPQ